MRTHRCDRRHNNSEDIATITTGAALRDHVTIHVAGVAGGAVADTASRSADHSANFAAETSDVTAETVGAMEVPSELKQHYVVVPAKARSHDLGDYYS